MRKLLANFALLIVSALCLAQNYTVFDSDNGLSSSLINLIFEDSNKMVWISTEDGLNRYNGFNIKTYVHNPEDPGSLADNYVFSVFQDREGHIFVSTHSGVQLYDYATDKFSPLATFSDGSASGQICQVLERSNGELWGIGNAVSRITVENGVPVLKKANLPARISYIDSAIEDSDGSLWLVKQKEGFYKLNRDGSFSAFYSSGEYFILSLYQDKSNNMYAAAVNGGLLRFNPSDGKFSEVPYNGGQRLPVRFLFSLSDDEIALGTDGRGLKVYNTNTGLISDFQFAGSDMNYSNLKVHSLMRDWTGNMWISIYQKGVLMVPVSSNNFNYIGRKSELRNIIGSCAVTSLWRDDEGTMWVGTDNDGIYGLSPDLNHVSHFRATGAQNSVPNVVSDLFEDSRHNLWAGSFMDGMGRLDRKTGRFDRLHLYNSSGKDMDYITDITEGRDSRLWIATMGGGIFYYDLNTNKVTGISSENADIPLYVTSILCASDGKLYIGTYDGALSIDTGAGYRSEQLTEKNIVHVLYQSRDGNIWIGGGDGITVWASGAGVKTRYTVKDGLPTNTVYGIQEDGAGMMWISTDMGFCRLNPSTRVIEVFKSDDGIQGNEFSKKADWADKDGTLWFAGISGITYFKPQEIMSSSKKWTVRIVDMYQHGRPVSKGMKSGRHEIINDAIYNVSDVYLSYADNAFTLLFATVEHNSPRRLTYSYRLNNRDWITLPAGQNRVSFSSLPPGAYHLQVKAMDNQIASDVKNLTIHIYPAWWASWWAKMLYFLISAGIVLYTLHRIKMQNKAKRQLLEYKQAEELNESKLQFFVNIYHELKSPLSLIINPLQKLIKTDGDRERQKDYRIMYRNSERILQLTNQLMDVRKISKGRMKLTFYETEMVDFIETVRDNFADQFATKNISLTFTHEGIDSMNLWVDPANIDKVFVNLLSNAYKFTPENGSVVINLAEKEADRKYAVISVIDNGIGIPESDLEHIFERFYQSQDGQKVYKGGTGIGLDLARSIVELHHGKIHAENNIDGPGSRFVVLIPEGNEGLLPDEIGQGEAPIQAVSENLPLIVDALPVEDSYASSRTKYHIYVIDDDNDVRDYLVGELSPDYHIMEFSNGREALEEMFKKAPDLVISDVVMPEMDGIELCEKIKSNINLNHIPVILLTGKSGEEDNIAGLKNGADAYITKPFNIDILKVTVQNLIEGRKILKNNYTGQQKHDDKLTKIEVRTPDDKLMERIMAAVNANLSNPDLTIQFLASEIGISRVHLYRKLKELTNQTTSVFIRNTRLAQAAKLLSEGKQSITEISSLVGFDNPAYFTTSFKKLYGVTPREYMIQKK